MNMVNLTTNGIVDNNGIVHKIFAARFFCKRLRRAPIIHYAFYCLHAINFYVYRLKIWVIAHCLKYR